MTVWDELLPISIEMAKRNLAGIWNFTNIGVLSHNEVLEMYRDNVDPNFTWKNVTIKDQAKVLAAPPCNKELDSTKLKQEFTKISPLLLLSNSFDVFLTFFSHDSSFFLLTSIIYRKMCFKK